MRSPSRSASAKNFLREIDAEFAAFADDHATRVEIKTRVRDTNVIPSEPWLNRTAVGVGLTSFFSDWSHEVATTILPAFWPPWGPARAGSASSKEPPTGFRASPSWRRATTPTGWHAANRLYLRATCSPHWAPERWRS